MKIVAAAIRSQDGEVHYLPIPARHHDIIWSMRDQGYAARDCHDQGFLTDEGQYVDRLTAKTIARNAGQLIEHRDNGGMLLFSEEVWEGRYVPEDISDRSPTIKAAYQYVDPNDQM